MFHVPHSVLSDPMPLHAVHYYASTALLLGLGRFFSYLHTQSVGPLGRGSARRNASTYILGNRA
jgi:hypothetical protein